jgi:hypothetical protein
MIILLGFFAAQVVDETASTSAIESAITGTKHVVYQSFECMNAQTKAQLLAHRSDATPEIIVDGALESCQHLRRAYIDAVTKPGTYISPAAGQEMANEWFRSLRDDYIKHIDEQLAKPDFAETRGKLTIMEWGNCVRGKAANWSRLSDDAATIGQAAVTACRDQRQSVVGAMGYQLRSKGIPVARAEGIVDRLQMKMKDVAVETIISERAKRLPEKR